MKENNTYNEEEGGKNLPDSLRVNPFSVPENFFDEQKEHILKQFQLECIIASVNVSKTENATEKSVPEGYFDDLSNSIFAKIAEQELKDKISEDGFSVPNAYFDELNQNIESIVSEERLKTHVPTLDFKVAENYFSQAEDQIFTKLAEDNLRDLVGSEAGFIVPENYFEQSNTAIEATILVEQWSSEIGKDHFNVPESYFAELTNQILAKTTNITKQETTIITLPKRLDWRKYAAAAAIACVIGVSSYIGVQYNSSNQLTHSEVNLQHVSDEEIISYLAQVSEGEELIKLTEYTSNSSETTSTLDSDIENEEIEEYLNYML